MDIKHQQRKPWLQLLLASALLCTGWNFGAASALAVPPQPQVVLSDKVVTENAVENGTSAVLNGTVSDQVYMGPDYERFFLVDEYVVSGIPQNGQKVPADPAAAGLAFQGQISGLTPGKSYQYSACLQKDGESVALCANAAAFQAYRTLSWFEPFELDLPRSTPLDEVKKLMPETVRAHFTDGTSELYPVSWNLNAYEWDSRLSGYKQYETGGQIIIRGAAELPDGNTVRYEEMATDDPRFIINMPLIEMTGAAPVEDRTVVVGTTLEQAKSKLPKRVEFSFEDGVEALLDVKWDSGTPAFDGARKGTYLFKGTPLCPRLDRRAMPASVEPGGDSCEAFANAAEVQASAYVHVVDYKWQLVGPAGFTPEPGSEHRFFYDAVNVPYVAFSDASADGALSVMKMEGGVWTYVGAPGFIGSHVSNVQAAFNSVNPDDKKLYVSFIDGDGTVKAASYEAGSWTSMPSAGSALAGERGALAMGMDWDGPALVYADAAADGKATMKIWSGAAWSSFGTPGFSDGRVSGLSIIDTFAAYFTVSAFENGVLNVYGYVYYPSMNWEKLSGAAAASPAGSALIPFKYNYDSMALSMDDKGVSVLIWDWNNRKWSASNLPPVLAQPAKLADVAVDMQAKVLYVAFEDQGKITVRKLNGSEWVTAGAAQFTAGGASELRLQIIDGIPHVSIVDDMHGGKLTVLNYRAWYDPAAVTGAASEVAETSARIEGSAQGTLSRRGMEYREQADGAAWIVIDGGQGPGSISVKLDLLKPGTGYEFRAYGDSQEGRTYGDIAAFRTKSQPETELPETESPETESPETSGPGASLPAWTPSPSASPTPTAAPTSTPTPAPTAGEYKAYMKGYPDGSFLPQGSVTRAEVAAILSRTMDKKASAATDAKSFKDVPSGFWAGKDIAIVAEQGWMNGSGDGGFRPGRAVTRAEMAQILLNVYGKQEQAAAMPSYPDAAGHWAAAAIASAEARGWLPGYADGKFHPNQPLTRVETVRLFNSLLGRSGNTQAKQVWTDVKPGDADFADIMAASVDYRF
ncbi:S-layer homology domain-containing protein [Paenibacillus pasadenensis]|uniref:S-layer homology domain-containing protein n=1 Tax=Paenibacillus pasadenensis TaxID=217090 RepID=UPI000414ADAB|nr:S-layer homology domain-containing protein [Paenibacillus pasadenensis]